MKFNKVCKKVLAYTLTSAMTMGFFAVSNINLTTAWAAEAAADITVSAALSTMETADGKYTVATGEGLTTLTVTAEDGISIAENATITLETGVTITGGKLAKNTVLKSDGTIANGSITGAILKDCTINGTSGSVTLNGNSAILAGSKTLKVTEGEDFNTLTLSKKALTAEDYKSEIYFSYPAAQEAQFEADLKNGKITVVNAGTDVTTATDDNVGAVCAHLQDGYLTYGAFDFTYNWSDTSLVATVVAKGNSLDGTKITVPFNRYPQYATAESVLSSFFDRSKKPTSGNIALAWKCLEERLTKANVFASGNAGTTAALKVTGEAEAWNDKVIDSKSVEIKKRDISGAKLVSNDKPAAGDIVYAFNTTELSDPNATVNKFSAEEGFNDVNGRIGNAAADGTTLKVKIVDNAGVLQEVNVTDGDKFVVTGLSKTAGAHTLTITATAANENYTGSFTVPYTIVDKNIDGGAYTGKWKAISAASLAEKETDNVTFDGDAPKYKDAGQYTFKYKVNNVEKTALFTITQAEVDGVWAKETATYTYDGTPKTIKIESIKNPAGGTLDDEVLETFDKSDVSYAFYEGSSGDDTDDKVDSCVNANKEAESYTIIATLGKNANKNFKFKETEKATLTIKRVKGEDIKVNVKDSYTAYADGKKHTIDPVTIDAPASYYNVFYKDSKAKDTEWSSTIPSYSEADTYKIEYKILKDEDFNEATNKEPLNVDLGDSGISGTVTLTIKPALTLKRTDKTGAKATYTGKYLPIKYEAYAGDELQSDVKVEVYARKTGTSTWTKITSGLKDVGTYILKCKTVIGDETSAFLSVDDDEVTISKISIAKATATAKAVTYNGKNQVPAVTVKVGGKTLKKNTDYTINSAKRINAGKYTIVITGKGSYTGTVKATFTINKRNVKYATIKKAYKKVKGKKVLKSYTVYYGKTKLVIKKNFKLTNKKVKSGKKYVNKKYVQGIGNYTGYKAF